MDKDDIRQNLAGYRPELYRKDDPLIAESLQAAEADPELSAWLQDQIDFDRMIASQLAATQPPAAAKENLILAQRAQARKTAKTRRRLALAAVLFLTGSLVGKYFLFPPAVEFAAHPAPTTQTFRDQMAYFASQRFMLDRFYSKSQKSANWLTSEGFPSITELPNELASLRGMGCKKIEWNQRKVGLICFETADKDIVHLFILDKDELHADLAQDARFGELRLFHERETMGWQDDERAYLLVGSEPGVRLAGLM